MNGPVGRAKRLAAAARETFPGRLVSKVVEDDISPYAVLIAWNALLAVFPIALALVAVLGVVLGRVGIDSRTIYDLIAAAFPSDAGRKEVLDALQAVQTQTGLLAVLALVGFLWTASNLFGTMERAFDLIYQVPRRDFVRQKLMSVLMMVIFTVLAGLAVLSTTLPALLDRLPGLYLSSSLSWLLTGDGAGFTQFVIGAVAGFLLFFAIYYVVPNLKQRIREVWVGALFAGLAFEVVTLVFPLYVKVAGGGMNRYGSTFAFLFVLMAFFYFVGLVTMLGTEINAVLYPPREAAERVERARAEGVIAEGQVEAGRRRSQGPRRLRRALYAAAGAVIGLFALSRRAGGQG
jgi:membrane protein